MPGVPNMACNEWQISLGPSHVSGAGNGVFVGAKVPKHRPVVFYHGSTGSASTVEKFTYSMTLKDMRTVVGFAKNKTKCGVGQLINDKAAIFVEHPTSWSRVQQQISTYREVSTAAANLEADEDDPSVFYSARQLAAGEELYLNYGPVYWLTLDGMKEADPSAALLGYMALSSMPEFGDMRMRQAKYNPETRQMEMDGAPLDEKTADNFITFLGLLPSSSIWGRLGLTDSSALDKIRALVEPLARDDMTMGERYDQTDPGYVGE